MKIFLLAAIALYLACDWVSTFHAWLRSCSKSKKEYWFRFADVILSGALLLGFIKLIDILATEVL